VTLCQITERSIIDIEFESTLRIVSEVSILSRLFAERSRKRKLPCYEQHNICVSNASDITRVGVTRGGTDGVTPFFLEKKLTTFFTHRPLESDDLFSCPLLTTPIFPRRLSSVLSIIQPQRKLILAGCHPPGGYHPGRSSPSLPPLRSDAIGPTQTQCTTKHHYRNLLLYLSSSTGEL